MNKLRSKVGKNSIYNFHPSAYIRSSMFYAPSLFKVCGNKDRISIRLVALPKNYEGIS